MNRILVAGSEGMIGSAVVRELRARGFEKEHLLTPLRRDLDYESWSQVSRYFQAQHPGYIVLAAGLVGGIKLNQDCSSKLLDSNLRIQANVIKANYEYCDSRLITLGSSCMYPVNCEQPMKEEDLFTGIMESSSQAYALSKLVGLQLCDAYNRDNEDNRNLCIIPNSVYGPGDNFDGDNGHVLAAIINKIHNAKRELKGRVVLWGTGEPRREFVYVGDLAEAICDLLYEDVFPVGPINYGVGSDISIRDLSSLISKVIGFEGVIEFDSAMPDGAFEKLLDSTRAKSLGWSPRTSLHEGITKTYRWYLDKFGEKD